MKVAYLGPHGTFSEDAAKQFYKDKNVSFNMFDTIPDVIEAVGKNTVDEAIVPLENTIEGTINMTLDSIISYEKLGIKDEFILPVSLHLISNQAVNSLEIKEVWSISPILTQCRSYIRERNMKSMQYNSSAAAATALKHSDRKDIAAIGSSSLAELLGLHMIEQNIQDNADNETKFVVISNEIIMYKDTMKTMFEITPRHDQPGILSSILNVFTALSINLSWIESRPTTRKLGKYRFFLESNNQCKIEVINKAVTILETLGYQVRILGRYNTFDNNAR